MATPAGLHIFAAGQGLALPTRRDPAHEPSKAYAAGFQLSTAQILALHGRADEDGVMREARYQDGELDEVVADDVASFHLEQMHDSGWWIGLTHADGTVTHINLFTKRAKIEARCEFDV